MYARGMKKLLLILSTLVLCAFSADAQKYSISGTITDKGSGEPVIFATVLLEDSGQWAVSDAKGFFSLANIAPGKHIVVVSSLGYVEDRREIVISKDISYNIKLQEDNLTLEGAVVTAQEDNGATTGRNISKTAIDHIQLMNISNVSSLLPGGVTVNPTLTSDQSFNVRGAKGEDGTPSFGTAVEVDGMRLSANASFGRSLLTSGTNVNGISTNNIASSNVESVEVITGVPSVEYGDMSSGIVKIETKKGKTPWTISMSTSPNMKQLSVNKGFGLGSNSSGSSRGVLNTTLEYTGSYSDKMSPYTSYDRKQISLTYSNTLTSGIFAASPLRFSASVTGNLGGLDDSADPDRHVESYTTKRDNALRGKITVSWLLNRTWITNLEFNASANYSDRLERQCTPYSQAVTSSSLHGMEKGYYLSLPYDESGGNQVVLIAPGYWSNVMILDDKPFNARVSLKATWSHDFGKVKNLLKLGGEWSADRNFGKGKYSEDKATAPTYREYPYCDMPLMSNISAYIEDNVMIPAGKEGRINLIAGIRNDNTIIPGSAYGTTSSLSPRFNLKYTILSERMHRDDVVRSLSLRASWGVSVKMPSYAILYPEPGYQDIMVFTSTASSSNTVNRAYFIIPQTIEYNSSLKWQRNNLSEVGADVNIAGVKISLVGFYNKTKDIYSLRNNYERFSYNYTGTSSVQGLDIPAQDRVYEIDRVSGVVTVSDAKGRYPSQQLEGNSRNKFIASSYEDNEGGDIRRYGLEWVVDFPRINPVNTSIRLDGTYYNYSSIMTDMVAYCPTSISSADGSHFKYIGYYYGGEGSSNANLRKNLNTNLTLTTNIPKVRMIISVKLEASLIKYSQFLSRREDGSARSYVNLSSDNLLDISDESFYENDCYVVTYPDYYESFDAPGVMRPFLEDFRQAQADAQKEKASGIVGGPMSQFYSDLGKLVTRTSYLYYYHPDRISPYFCVNFSVTKEIGELASISFYANNFFNNQGQVYSSKTGNYSSVTGYIPSFYYGLTARFKF